MENKTSASTEVPEENKMGTLPIGKLLATMSIPMMVSMLFQALYNVVDSVFVAMLSQDAMNAVSLAFPLQTLMISVATGTGVGMNAVLSRSLGEKNQAMANKTANTGIFLYLCSSVVFALVALLTARPFFQLQTSNQAIIDYGADYINVCLGCSLGLFFQVCSERLLQSTGRTHLSMITQIIGAITNIILDPIFIFGLFGMPRLEVAGAAIATVIGQFAAAIAGIILNIRCNKEITLQLKEIRFDSNIAGNIYRIGLPSIIMQSIGSVMTFAMNRILISFTEAATAVFGAYFKLQSFIFMPVFGLNNGMVPIVSYNYGAARPERVKKAILLTILTAVGIMSFGTLLFEMMPGTLLGLFSPSEEMLKIGLTALRIIALHFPVAGFCIIAGSVCQAIGNPIHSLITSVCRQLVVLLPAAWLLSLTGQLELVWFSFLIAEAVALVLNIFFLRGALHRADAQMRAADQS